MKELRLEANFAHNSERTDVKQLLLVILALLTGVLKGKFEFS